MNKYEKSTYETEVPSAREKISRCPIFRKRKDLCIIDTENERTLTIIRNLNEQMKRIHVALNIHTYQMLSRHENSTSFPDE